MATVTNNMTRISDAEGTITTANWPSGGGGAGANTDIFLQGSQSLGRRQTTTGTAAGFVLEDAANNNCSAADVHVGMWFWVTQYAIIDDLKLGFASNTGSPTNFDSHNFDYANEYPSLGGWVRAWIDVSRTPDATGGTGLDESALRTYGIQVSFTGTPGGTSPNLIIDAADFVAGAALSLTGTSGLWSDFSTADANTTNQYGVFRLINGVYSCFGRVQLGTASSLAFNDSGFTIIFPRQSLVASTWMGINVDLQNASTNIDWSAGALTSAYPSGNKGDLVVTGTSGTLDATGCAFSALRIVTLTAACTMTNCSFTNCGLITPAGAVLDGCTFSGATDTRTITIPGSDVSNVTDCSFTSDGSNHAIEITGSASSFTLTGLLFSGYAAGSAGSPVSTTNTGNEAVYVNIASGTVTLNISGGTTPSVRSAGATVNVVSSVTVSLTGLKNPSEVRVYTAGTTTEISGTGAESVISGTHNFSIGSGVAVDISILALGYQNLRILNYSTTVTASVPVSQVLDRQYANP